MASQPARSSAPRPALVPPRRRPEHRDGAEPSLIPPSLRSPVEPEELRARLDQALDEVRSGRDPGTSWADVLQQWDKELERHGA